MAVSWTALAQKYRLLQSNVVLPIAKFSSRINAKCAMFDKQCSNRLFGCHCFQNIGAESVLSMRGSLVFRKYSCIVWTKIDYGKQSNLSKYSITGCQKCTDGFPLVKHRSRFHTSSKHTSTRLTPAEATNILRKHEYTTEEPWMGPETGNSPVKAFDMNSIRSNNPTEDAHSEAILRVGTAAPNGMLFVIFDGHGGAACGQVRKIAAIRKFEYEKSAYKISPLTETIRHALRSTPLFHVRS